MRCTIGKLVRIGTVFCISYLNLGEISIRANPLTALGLVMLVWQFVVVSTNVLIFRKGYECPLYCEVYSIMDPEERIIRTHRDHVAISTSSHLFRHHLEYK